LSRATFGTSGNAETRRKGPFAPEFGRFSVGGGAAKVHAQLAKPEVQKAKAALARRLLNVDF